MDGKIEILVNGERKEVSGGQTLGDLIDRLKLDRRQIAVELNREIIKREEWDSTDIEENDAIEIVHFVGGGSV